MNVAGVTERDGGGRDPVVRRFADEFEAAVRATGELIFPHILRAVALPRRTARAVRQPVVVVGKRAFPFAERVAGQPPHGVVHAAVPLGRAAPPWPGVPLLASAHAGALLRGRRVSNGHA